MVNVYVLFWLFLSISQDFEHWDIIPERSWQIRWQLGSSPWPSSITSVYILKGLGQSRCSTIAGGSFLQQKCGIYVPFWVLIDPQMCFLIVKIGDRLKTSRFLLRDIPGRSSHCWAAMKTASHLETQPISCCPMSSRTFMVSQSCATANRKLQSDGCQIWCQLHNFTLKNKLMWTGIWSLFWGLDVFPSFPMKSAPGWWLYKLYMI